MRQENEQEHEYLEDQLEFALNSHIKPDDLQSVVAVTYTKADIDAAVASEREACAKVCDNYLRETRSMTARGCLVSVAYEIRDRVNNTKE